MGRLLFSRLSAFVSLSFTATAIYASTPLPFPAGLVPFSSITSVSGPDTQGNHLIVGRTTLAAWQQIYNLPIPYYSGQTFSDGVIQLAPGQFYSNVLVSSFGEREGNFSDTTNPLIDPDTGLRFPGNIIPLSRLGDVYAFLVGPPVPSSGALHFVPLNPCRVADTRNAVGAFGGPYLSANTTRTFAIQSSACNVPTSALAYSLNVTVVPHVGLGYLSVWPAGQAQPVVSTLNSDGRVKANAAIVQAGTGGGITFFASDDTELVIDINGYFVDASSNSGLAFYPLTPCRIADTRLAAGDLGGPVLATTQTRTFPILESSCNIPSSAQAYSLNMTAIPVSHLGYLSDWPTGQGEALVSTLNGWPGVVTANASLVPAGTSGSVNVYASNGTDLVIDTNGYFGAPATSGSSFYTVTPCRVFDSRLQGQIVTGTLQVPVASLCNVLPTAKAVVVNATVVPQSWLGFLSLWAYGTSQPAVSTLNSDDGAITSNMAIVPIGGGGINVYSSNPTNVIIDVLGFYF